MSFLRGKSLSFGFCKNAKGQRYSGTYYYCEKTPIKTAYLSQRNTKTDFPVLACCVSMSADGMKAVYGARPSKAFLLEDAENILKAVQTLSEEEKGSL